MVIVAGCLRVAPESRAAYVAGCVTVVTAARSAPGCLDFCVAADLVDPGRVNVYERWESAAAVAAFRGSGPDDDQQAVILDAAVSQFEIASEQPLT